MKKKLNRIGKILAFFKSKGFSRDHDLHVHQKLLSETMRRLNRHYRYGKSLTGEQRHKLQCKYYHHKRMVHIFSKYKEMSQC